MNTSYVFTIATSLVASGFTAGLAVGSMRTKLRAIDSRLKNIENLFVLQLRGINHDE